MKTSAWLTAVPLAVTISIRYHSAVTEEPMHCDGCEATFDLDHGLNCRNGGLVNQRHNELREVLGELSVKAYGTQVAPREPILVEGEEPPTSRLDGEKWSKAADGYVYRLHCVC
eukprot:GHVN01006293.1.p1 GENE.GHVN01006293.1~~GHVN01006293.1.p1  ORF type:complete len:114 (-),score=9.64 GHVN01006293.1:294-635(-)